MQNLQAYRSSDIRRVALTILLNWILFSNFSRWSSGTHNPSNISDFVLGLSQEQLIEFKLGEHHLGKQRNYVIHAQRR